MPYGAGEGMMNLAQFLLGVSSNGGGNGAPAPSFGQRLANGGLAMTEGYDKFIDQQNRINAAGKSADYMRKAMGDDAEQQTGITDEEWGNLGAKEKAAAAQGFVQKQSIAQILAQTKEENARADYFATRNNPDADPEAAAKKNFAQRLLQSTAPGQGPTLAGPPMTARMPEQGELMRMMLQSGMDPVQSLTASSRMDGSGDDQPPTSTDIGGVPYVWKKGSKEFQPRADFVPNLKTDNLLKVRDAQNDELTDEQRQSLIVQHGNARTKLLDLLGKTNATQFPDAYKAINDELGQHAAAIEGLRKGSKETTPPAGTKTATVDIAKQYLDKFGGDKDKTRAALKKDGYSF